MEKMIGYLEGRIIEIDERGIVVLVGGVGYRLLVPASFLEKASKGADVSLHVSMVVGERDMTLYGFPQPTERRFFETVLKISGIGPGTALRLLGKHTLDDLTQAIREQNVALLEAIPGIGKKTAQRIMIELSQSLDGLPAGAATSTHADVRDALKRMGYTQREIDAMTASLPAEGTVEDFLRLALQSARA